MHFVKLSLCLLLHGLLFFRKLKMLQRTLRQFISSNQLILNFPRTCDVKWFSLSSIYSKKAFGLRPPPQPFNLFRQMAYPRLKDKHPNSRATEISKLAAEEWKQLSETEKEEYREMCKDRIKEYKADDTKQEIERMRKEIEELVHDRPAQYLSTRKRLAIRILANFGI